jgi:hypothetical protein
LELECIVSGYNVAEGVGWQEETGRQRRETDPFDGPAKDGCLGVFHFCQLATLEDSDRIDDAQSAVEFSARNVIVHTLLVAVITMAA